MFDLCGAVRGSELKECPVFLQLRNLHHAAVNKHRAQFTRVIGPEFTLKVDGQYVVGHQKVIYSRRMGASKRSSLKCALFLKTYSREGH
jgi:hypothetical protein